MKNILLEETDTWICEKGSGIGMNFNMNLTYKKGNLTHGNL